MPHMKLTLDELRLTLLSAAIPSTSITSKRILEFSCGIPSLLSPGACMKVEVMCPLSTNGVYNSFLEVESGKYLVFKHC